jgi:hypothetical protein
MVSTATSDEVLRDCAAALRRMLDYRLPPALDRRLLTLSENKEALSAEDRDDLLALVDFAEARTIEKLQAEAILRRLTSVWPHLANGQ